MQSHSAQPDRLCYNEEVLSFRNGIILGLSSLKSGVATLADFS